jgi:hypothetical protein
MVGWALFPYFWRNTGSAPNPEVEKVGDGYAVIHSLKSSIPSSRRANHLAHADRLASFRALWLLSYRPRRSPDSNFAIYIFT